MGRILDALATDNLSLMPSFYEGSAEYRRARNLFADLGEELLTRLNEEEKKLLEDYTSAQADESQIYSVDRFVTGYRLGVLMTMEVFAGKNDLILDGTGTGRKEGVK